MFFHGLGAVVLSFLLFVIPVVVPVAVGMVIFFVYLLGGVAVLLVLIRQQLKSIGLTYVFLFFSFSHFHFLKHGKFFEFSFLCLFPCPSINFPFTLQRISERFLRQPRMLSVICNFKPKNTLDNIMIISFSFSRKKKKNGKKTKK